MCIYIYHIIYNILVDVIPMTNTKEMVENYGILRSFHWIMVSLKLYFAVLCNYAHIYICVYVYIPA